MSYLENSLKRTLKTCQFPDKESYFTEKVLRYQKKSFGYVGQLTETINKIEQYFSKNYCSKSKKYGNSLDEIIVRVYNVTTELNKIVAKDGIEVEIDRNLKILQ